MRTLTLDKQLVKDAQSVVDMYTNKKIDPVSKQRVSDETAEAAKGVVEIFSNIVKQKSIRLAIVNTTNAVIDKTKAAVSDVVDKAKAAASEFARELINTVPVPTHR